MTCQQRCAIRLKLFAARDGALKMSVENARILWCNMCRLLASAANYIDDMNEQLRAQEKMAKDTCDLLTRQLLEATNAADAMREDVVDLANDLQLGHVCETCSRRENCLKNKTGWLSNKQCVDWEYKKFVTDVVDN